MAASFGAEGEPINKTALLLELQSRVRDLEGVYLTIVLETTSDWTHVSFNGMSILETGTYAILDGESSIYPIGSYPPPFPNGITCTGIQLLKKARFDETYLRILFPMRVKVTNATISMLISKGNVGYTTVTVKDRNENTVGVYTDAKANGDYYSWPNQVGEHLNLMEFKIAGSELSN